MTVRAKMRCFFNENGQIRLAPVVGGSAENDSFYKFTPGGSVTLDTINERAAEQFVVGTEYYVDFTPAPNQV